MQYSLYNPLYIRGYIVPYFVDLIKKQKTKHTEHKMKRITRPKKERTIMNKTERIERTKKDK